MKIDWRKTKRVGNPDRRAKYVNVKEPRAPMWGRLGSVRGNVHARHPVSAAASVSGPRKWERIEVFRLPTVVSSARRSLPFSSSSRRTAPVIELHTTRRCLFTRLRFQIALPRIIRTGLTSTGRCADCTAGVFPLRVQKPVVRTPTEYGRCLDHVTLSRGVGEGHYYVRRIVSSVSGNRSMPCRTGGDWFKSQKNISVFSRKFEISPCTIFFITNSPIVVVR